MITIIAALLVLAWARLSRTPLRDLGFVAPKNWLAMIVLGGVFGIAFKLLMKAVVMPLLGAPAHNPAYQFLVGNWKTGLARGSRSSWSRPRCLRRLTTQTRGASGWSRRRSREGCSG